MEFRSRKPCRNRKVTVVKILLTSLEVISLIFAFIMQYLSKKKMGVMRYLVFKNRVYKETFLSNYWMDAYIVCFIIGIAICTIFFIYMSKVKKNNKLKLILIYIIIINAVAIYFIIKIDSIKLLAYPYFLISIFVVSIIEFIRLIYYSMQKSL